MEPTARELELQEEEKSIAEQLVELQQKHQNNMLEVAKEKARIAQEVIQKALEAAAEEEAVAEPAPPPEPTQLPAPSTNPFASS